MVSRLLLDQAATSTFWWLGLEEGGNDEEGVEESMGLAGGGGGGPWNLTCLGTSSWQVVGDAALFLKMPLRVGFHSSSLPCLVGALLIDLSISSVVAVGLGTLFQSSISDSLRSWGSSVSVHSRSGISGEVGAGGGVVELLCSLLITTPLNIIFGFLLTDLLNS